MKTCLTEHMLFYCWYTGDMPQASAVKPNDFESLPFADTVTVPNKTIALAVYHANCRIKMGRK